MTLDSIRNSCDVFFRVHFDQLHWGIHVALGIAIFVMGRNNSKKSKPLFHQPSHEDCFLDLGLKYTWTIWLIRQNSQGYGLNCLNDMYAAFEDVQECFSDDTLQTLPPTCYWEVPLDNISRISASSSKSRGLLKMCFFTLYLFTSVLADWKYRV